MNAKIAAALLLISVCPAARASDDASEWRRLNREGTRALEKNDFAHAEQLLMKAVAKAEKFGPEDKRYAESFRPLAHAATELHDYQTADLAYTRLAYADGKRLGTNDLRVAQDLLDYVEIAGFTQQFVLGREALDRATTIVAQKLGKFSRGMGLCYAARAGLELQENLPAAADANFQKALELLEGTQTVMHFSGEDMQMKQAYFSPPPIFVANVLNKFAICQRQERKYAEAEASLRRSLDLLEREYGKGSLYLFNGLFNLASVYNDEGKLSEAESAGRRALSLARAVDRSNPAAQSARALLAKILLAEGKNAEARKFAQ